MSAIERAYLQEAADYEIERDEANFRFGINMRKLLQSREIRENINADNYEPE